MLFRSLEGDLVLEGPLRESLGLDHDEAVDRVRQAIQVLGERLVATEVVDSKPESDILVEGVLEEDLSHHQLAQ